MKIEVDFQNVIPIYEQIAQQILEQINAGFLKTGDQLPTVRKLAVDLGVNFNTIARSYRTLDKSGYISTQHGRGTFILETQKKKITQKDKDKNIEELTRFYLRKATYLGFEPEEIKTCFEQIYQEGEQE